MLVLICGPSGSGKTTLLNEIPTHSDFNIGNVYVHRQLDRNKEEVGKLSVSSMEFKQQKFTFTYEYSLTKYGFILNREMLDQQIYWFVDYPGEYPKCPELQQYNWLGILVLPPSLSILEHRLRSCGRDDRIVSAGAEYQECIYEKSAGLFNPKKWIFFESSDFHRLKSFTRNLHTTLDKLNY